MTRPDLFRILVVEDDAHTSKAIMHVLEFSGFEVSTALSGSIGLDLIRRFGAPHLALVDINMPGIDGFEFCEAARELCYFPIIMLTAINDHMTISQAIDQFAEDYIVKPFSNKELITRINRILRSVSDFSYALDTVMQIDKHLTINVSNCQLMIDGETQSLTSKEAKLLYILAKANGRTVTTDFLLQHLWPMEQAKQNRLRIVIHRLRQKIESQYPLHNYIKSERGIGYTLIMQD
ncbi:MAG: response regulator transcription factor [Chloroflexi bacterium]|nr:response regulator transcription factor [Chloroflexota bacterium]